MDNRNSFFGNIPSATKNILIINVLVFLATILINNFNVIDFFGMYFWQMQEFKVYQILTHIFVHNAWTEYGKIDFTHIFSNMLGLFMFGSTLEHFWGAKKFLFYYFFSALGAAFLEQLVWFITGTNAAIAIGASGAIFGLLLAYGMMFPNEKIYFYFVLPIKAKYFVIFYGLAELFFGVARFSNDNVGHFAHLGGLVFGLILMLYWRKKGKLYNGTIR